MNLILLEANFSTAGIIHKNLSFNTAQPKDNIPVVEPKHFVFRHILNKKDAVQQSIQ